MDATDSKREGARRTFGLDEAGHGGDNVMVNVVLLGISPESVMVAKIEPSGD
jgi:hypothetical protein